MVLLGNSIIGSVLFKLNINFIIIHSFPDDLGKAVEELVTVMTMDGDESQQGAQDK